MHLSGSPHARAPTLRAAQPSPWKGTTSSRTFNSPPAKRCPNCACITRRSASAHRDAHGRVDNAVLILHGTGGSGHSFLVDRFAGVLFGKGQLLDTNRYYIILPDGIGHGESSKPSDGLHAHFPQYDYDDMVDAQHALVDPGAAGGSFAPGDRDLHGLHAFVDVGGAVSRFHGCADAPCLPAGADRGAQSRVARSHHGCDSFRSGSGCRANTAANRRARLRTAAGILLIAGSAPIQMQIALPTRDAADEFVQKYMEREISDLDANDLLYQVNASRNYDPSARSRQDHRCRSCGSIRRTISSIRRSSASRSARSNA